MFNLKISVLAITLVMAAVVDAKFPKNPKPCPYGDSECMKNMINFLLKEKIDGYSSLNLVSLNPLKISKISIKQGAESPVNIDLQLRQSDLKGIEGATATQVQGFGKDLTQPHEVVIGADSVTLLSDYTINGRVLILPINGNGKSNMTLDNIKLKMTFRGEPLDKNGETYMNVKDLKLNLDTSRMYFHFTNLFNGDKALGDNMNAFLNENWKDIFGEVRQSITSAFASIFQSVINNVFQKYPYNKMFASE